MPIDDFPGDTPDPTETGPGKYIKLSVPNFNLAPSDQPSAQMTSYLRIGAVEDLTTAGKKPPGLGSPNVDPTGEDLASLVSEFADDTRIRDRDGAATGNLPALESVTPGSPTTINDGSITMRTAESGFLHKKGGWRDHSDGNRITTTRGDKVEVIRGNYKLLVLGRRDAYDESGNPDFSNAAGWDVSGGLVDTAQDDFGNTSGEPTTLDTEYVWKINSDNRWGWTSRTKTGSWNPAVPTGNGKVISYTWVDESWTYLGSPDLDVSAPDLQITNPEAFATTPPNSLPRPVKKLVNKAWAETIVQETHATAITTTPNMPAAPASLTSTTTSQGDMTITVHADGSVDNQTSAGGDITNHMSTSAAVHNLTSAIGDITDVTAAVGTHTSLDTSLTIFNFELALLIMEIKSVVHLDIHAGIHMDMHVIDHYDFHTTLHQQVTNFKTDDALEANEIRLVHQLLRGQHVELINDHMCMSASLKFG